jgi:LacI family gluconate utilization system Gnt-I transcriptional repressor
MGRNAATMVIEAMEGRRPENRVVDLGFTVMVRQSSVRPGQAGRASAERQSAAE